MLTQYNRFFITPTKGSQILHNIEILNSTTRQVEKINTLSGLKLDKIQGDLMSRDSPSMFTLQGLCPFHSGTVPLTIRISIHPFQTIEIPAEFDCNTKFKVSTDTNEILVSIIK